MQNIVIHVNGNTANDTSVYITDASYQHWYAVGLIQEISVVIEANNPYPELSLNAFGLNYRTIEKPKFSSGIIAILENSIVPNKPQTPSVKLLCISKTIGTNGPIDGFSKLNSIEKVSISASVKTGKSSCVFKKNEMFKLYDEMYDIPDWVTLHL